MRGLCSSVVVSAFVVSIFAAGVAPVHAQGPIFVTSVTADVNHTTITFAGGGFCATPNVIIPAFGSTPLTPVGPSTATLITVAYPAGAEGAYLVAIQCGSTFFYYFAVLDPLAPGSVATLGTNTFTGSQTITGGLHVTGDVVVDGNIGAKYQDVAEWVDSAEPLAAGMIVVIDAAASNRVTASTRAYATSVAGAVSAQPGIILGERGAGRVLVSQSGRVRVKADARYGAIKAGDLLVSSPTKGYAMRSQPIRVGDQRMHRPGTVLGKALEALPSGRGDILVLLTLQ